MKLRVQTQLEQLDSAVRADNMPVEDASSYSPPKIVSQKKEAEWSSLGVHKNITCDGCGQKHIHGSRYRSLEMDFYNLCEECERDRPVEHPPEYPMVKYNTPMGVGSTHVQGIHRFSMKRIKDVSVIQNNSSCEPVVPIIKTWRVQNTGAMTWRGVEIFLRDWCCKKFHSWDQRGHRSSDGTVNIPSAAVPTTRPGETVDIPISLLTPGTCGKHKAYFLLRTPNGTVFGDQLMLVLTVGKAGSKQPTSSPLAGKHGLARKLARKQQIQQFRPAHGGPRPPGRLVSVGPPKPSAIPWDVPTSQYSHRDWEPSSKARNTVSFKAGDVALRDNQPVSVVKVVESTTGIPGDPQVVVVRTADGQEIRTSSHLLTPLDSAVEEKQDTLPTRERIPIVRRNGVPEGYMPLPSAPEKASVPEKQPEEKLDHVPTWAQPSNQSQPTGQFPYQQMSQLTAMGFRNDRVLRFLLQEKKGKVEHVVDSYHLYSL